MTSRPVIAVIQHQPECPPALFGGWLDAAGAALQVFHPADGAELPEPADLAGLIVLGGEMGANDDQVAPWLPAVRALLREAATEGVPTLGICLSHQLAAVALGGTVIVNPLGKTRGVTPLGWTSDAADDRLFRSWDAPARVVHSNNDVVSELPPGAVVLARSPGGEVQAARFSATVWGVQWHPEVDHDTFAGWSRMEPPTPEAEAEQQLADLDAARPDLDLAGQFLALRFAALAAERDRALQRRRRRRDDHGSAQQWPRGTY